MQDERETEAKIGAAAPVEAAHRPRYALLVMGERTTAALFTLPEDGETTIGRSDQCALRIDDPLLSRVHAVVRRAGDGFVVVDRGSMNGSWVGEARLEPNVPHPVAVGDAIRIGRSSLVLQFAAGGARPRRLWSHGYFEARLEDECARAEQTGRSFAIARIRVDAGTAPAHAEKTIADVLRPIDVIASYAEHEYELLFVETSPAAAEALVNEIANRLDADGARCVVSVACWPRDGRTPEALVSRASHPEEEDEPVEERGGDVVRSGALARLEPLVAKVAASPISVLVLGETGVGKEVLARTIHERSPRVGKPLVCLNCASLSESLLESELFGHEKGAFTGAVAAKPGLLESANGGTAFLDEIGEMPLSLQAKLLRVLEQREVLRVGALTPRPIDVRFLAATNRDLEQEIARGRFRQDLYYRLNGFSLVIPPLRERKEEIEPLAKHFVRLACEVTRRRPLDITREALEALLAYEWPGNVRELKNVMERAVLLCSGRAIAAEHLPREKMGRVIAPSRPPPAYVPPPVRRAPGSFAPLSEVEITIASASSAGLPTIPPPAPPTASTAGGPAEEEKRRIVAALERCAGNQTQAAKLLGISRQTLVTRIEAYNLPRPRKRA